ncbi:Uncharacterised protein [Comamonas terrigena]|nr:Uncharacterised protein [Comamonas terrigena]
MLSIWRADAHWQLLKIMLVPLNKMTVDQNASCSYA